MAVEGTDGLGPLRDRPISGPRNCGTALKRIFRSFFFANVFCSKNMAVEGTDGLGPLRGGRILAARTAGLFSRIHLQTKVVIFKCFF